MSLEWTWTRPRLTAPGPGAATRAHRSCAARRQLGELACRISAAGRQLGSVASSDSVKAATSEILPLRVSVSQAPVVPASDSSSPSIINLLSVSHQSVMVSHGQSLGRFDLWLGLSAACAPYSPSVRCRSIPMRLTFLGCWFANYNDYAILASTTSARRAVFAFRCFGSWYGTLLVPPTSAAVWYSGSERHGSERRYGGKLERRLASLEADGSLRLRLTARFARQRLAARSPTSSCSSGPGRPARTSW